MCCESLVFLMALIQVIMEIMDIRNIGKRRWWQVLKSFPAKILYKVSLFLTLSIVPIRFMCGLGDNWLFFDNMFSLLSVIMTTIHFLFYCRAVKFVGPFVLMVSWAQVKFNPPSRCTQLSKGIWLVSSRYI